jgi:hypothetical protein
MSVCKYLCNGLNGMRFVVQTSVSLKMIVCWVVAPCSPIEVYRRFRGICVMVETGVTSETSVNFCRTVRRNIILLL